MLQLFRENDKFCYWVIEATTHTEKQKTIYLWQRIFNKLLCFFHSLMQKVFRPFKFSYITYESFCCLAICSSSLHIISTRETILSSFHNNKFIATIVHTHTRINKIIIVWLIFLCNSNSTWLFLLWKIIPNERLHFTSGRCLLEIFSFVQFIISLGFISTLLCFEIVCGTRAKLCTTF